METGFRADSEGRTLPRDIIRRFHCSYDGETVFSAELFPAIAANPYLRFFVTAKDTGNLTFEWIDDSGAQGSANAAVTVV